MADVVQRTLPEQIGPSSGNAAARELIRRIFRRSTVKMEMNATLTNGGKVHRLVDGFARCGVGRNAKVRSWQTEFGAVTCGRCLRLERKESLGATPKPTRETRVLHRD